MGRPRRLRVAGVLWDGPWVQVKPSCAWCTFLVEERSLPDFGRTDVMAFNEWWAGRLRARFVVRCYASISKGTSVVRGRDTRDVPELRPRCRDSTAPGLPLCESGGTTVPDQRSISAMAIRAADGHPLVKP